MRYTRVREWPFAASLLGVVIGIATLVPTPIGLIMSVGGTGIGLVILVRDAVILRRRWAAYDFSSVIAPFPRDEIAPPAEYPSPEYTYFPNRGTVLTSSAVDLAVQADSFTVSVLEQDYRLPGRLQELAPYVLATINRGKVVFNGPFLGLADDPLPVGSGFAPLLHLHRARYFDGQCSNELCVLRAIHQPTGRETDLRRQELVSPRTGRLRTLAESDLANGIGVSTLAFTTDDHLVVVPQTSNNIASAQLLAPSGSGSLEPRDLPSPDGLGAPIGLNSVLVEGMNRELREETGLRPHEIGSTHVLGFGRWLERGARPEFFGFTRLTISSSEVGSRRLSGGEDLYAGRLELHPIDLDALGRDLAAGSGILDTTHLPTRLSDTGALPLLIALGLCARWRFRTA